MAARGTQADKERFLDFLADTANVFKSAQMANISRKTVYNWRESDPDFAAAWTAAVDRGTDALEDEAVRRANEGYDEPVFYQGVQCGVVRKYSDTLLMFMLKGRRPEKFKDRVANEVTGAGGGPIEEIRRIVIDPRNTDT